MRARKCFESAMQDFRYAIRQLRRSPAFACTAIFVLGLGISAAVSIFGLVETALIKPLPYRDQTRLVAAFESSRSNPRCPVPYLDFMDWRKLNTVFSSIDAYALNGGFMLSGNKGAQPVTGTRVSPGFFHTLGVTPVLGRDFRPDEDFAAASQAVLISYAAWQQRFGGRGDVLGEAIVLNGIPRTIIGVLPREFHFAPVGRGEFWANLRSTDTCEQNRGCQNLNTVARLKDGASLHDAAAEIQVIARQLESSYPDTHRGLGGATIVPIREVVLGDVRPILILLLAGAGVLLLIACVNVTTLVLARSDSRQCEVAMRISFGASTARLLQQFAVEGLVLAISGGGLGLLLSDFVLRILVHFVPSNELDKMPYLQGLGSDLHTVEFTCWLSLLAGVLFAVIPVWRISLSQITEGLRQRMAGGGGLRWRQFGASLVVVEVALAMVLMTCAGLIGKSLYALLNADTGMKMDHLLSVDLKWPLTHYSSDDEKIALGQQIVEKISALPSVNSVAISLASPLGAAWGSTSFHITGHSNLGEHNQVLSRQVSSGYFTTLQAPLIRGRYFREGENQSQPRVAIINRTLANKYFAGEDPIGRQIYYDWAPNAPMEIVGIVEDIKEGPIQNANLPVLYVPFDQNPKAWFSILVRTSRAEQSLVSVIPAAIHRIDADIAVSDAASMTDRVQNSSVVYLHRSSAWIAGGFASTAFVLGVFGLYGVVAYSVGRRTREIGVRMALGATRNSVHRLVLGEAAHLVAGGAALGICGSVWAATLIRGSYYGVRVWDVPTLAAAVSVLIVAALLASYLPAHHAASINPNEALRAE